MIFAVIPVKRLAEAKGRLAGRLTGVQRSDLVMAMLKRTVESLLDSGMIDQLALVSPEPELAARLGVDLVPDAGDLNGSLQNAVRWALTGGAGSLLIVPADLPAITPAAIGALRPRQIPGVVVVPAHDGGTGALLLSPPDVIPPVFGPDSFAIHRRLATDQSVEVVVQRDRALEFDLDTEADYDRQFRYLQQHLLTSEAGERR